MRLVERLAQWKEQGLITPEQQAVLIALESRQCFSVFLELNALLYLGVLALITGLSLTIGRYFLQLGDLSILVGLSLLFTGSLYYCFNRSRPYAAQAVESPTLLLDYILYFGCLVYSVEVSYLETHLHLLGARWPHYLLISTVLFGFLAYRFDNRFVLSLTLSTLATWCGFKISAFQMPFAAYRLTAIGYGMGVLAVGAILHREQVKAHFLGTYLNFAAHFLFLGMLGGVFERTGFLLYFIGLMLLCAVAVGYAIQANAFVYLVYAVIYGYIGLSSVLLRHVSDLSTILMYFLVSGIGVVVLIVWGARRFAREE